LRLEQLSFECRLILETNGLSHVVKEASGYAQVNDTTLSPRSDNYAEEAMYERMVPGEGELPLRDILAALPRDIVIGLEVPRRSLALAGVHPADRLRPWCRGGARLVETPFRVDAGRWCVTGGLASNTSPASSRPAKPLGAGNTQQNCRGGWLCSGYS
jgi:hypothetical protein